jgi:hypothetical protein
MIDQTTNLPEKVSLLLELRVVAVVLKGEVSTEMLPTLRPADQLLRGMVLLRELTTDEVVAK